ncbi:MAG: NAD(P)-dependent oxidoreductase [Bryobacteraceae bacterium]
MSAAALPVPENLERFPEWHPALDANAALVEAHRCLYCADAPCTGACPTHIDVPRFIKKIASGNLRGSARAILDANILGLSCARVCPVDVLCQGACVMQRYNAKPIQIGLLQRFAMDAFYDSGTRLAAAAPARKGRVACVGGGPASLSCAAELRRNGYAATIIDNRPLPGGLNTYGVAEYKLRPSDSLREIDLVRRLGVEFQQGTVGGTVALESLERDYDFIFLGMGLGAMERLGIPGEELGGVIDALKFIERYKTASRTRVGPRVVVVGAGNTAIDAANAARRLGAEEVHIIYRRTEREMPAFRFEYENSRVEGVEFHWLLAPVAILATPEEPGRVGALRVIRTRTGAPDASGRSRPEPVPGSEFDFPCDQVIPAVGQSRLMENLESSHGIRLRQGTIDVDRATGQTSNSRYFAGGDCVNGGREVVDAVADGKRAARAIIARLEVR